MLKHNALCVLNDFLLRSWTLCGYARVPVVKLTVLRGEKRDPWAAGFSVAVGHQQSEVILGEGFQSCHHVTKYCSVIVH